MQKINHRAVGVFLFSETAGYLPPIELILSFLLPSSPLTPPFPFFEGGSIACRSWCVEESSLDKRARPFLPAALATRKKK